MPLLETKIYTVTVQSAFELLHNTCMQPAMTTKTLDLSLKIYLMYKFAHASKINQFTKENIYIEKR